MLPEEELGFLSNNADVDLKALMKSWERTFQELFGIESMTYMCILADTLCEGTFFY